MLLGERGAHRCDNGLEPRLPQRDHVGVALDHDRAVLLRDRRTREVEAIEDAALLEEIALGRVDVLALQRIVFTQLARLEADHPAARVGEGEHEPGREVVVAALVRQPGGAQLLVREPLLACLRGQAVAGREPEAELLRDLLAETAAREIGAHRLPVGALPEVALEEGRRLIENGEEALTALARLVGLRRGLLVLERDPEPLRQPLDRSDEVESLGLADEGDDVAALAAAEAVIQVEVGVDREARRALFVKRAPAHVPRARALAQRRAQPHDLDDVGGVDDVANALVLDPRHLLAANVREREAIGHARRHSR